MLKRLKLLHHHHSGSLTPHEHTSYIPLLVLLSFVGLILGTYTANAATPTPRPGPASGSVGMTGTMPGKPPTVAATIRTPTNGQRFSATPITVAGTCPENTLVELFKNDIFAGSTTCQANGTYTIEIDLLIGQNTLVARVYDDLNQPGPDSNSVIVYYDALPAQSDPLNTLDFGGAQLIINTDAVFRGVFPEKEMVIPIDVIGGTAPYAVNVQWGDSTNKVVPRGDNETFTVEHTYKKAGVYDINLQATDAAGRVAFLTVAAIVNGQPPVAAQASVAAKTTGILLALWPLYTAIVAAVLSFWLGEKREKQVLQSHGLLVAQ